MKVKSYDFALRIVKLYKHLSENKKEFVLSKQILRPGTSIGSNVAEANQAQSKSDFIHKLSVAHKEAFETDYWLCLLRDILAFHRPSLFWSTVGNCRSS